MEFRFNRSLQYFYAATLIVVLATMAFGVRYFWANGPFNTSNITSVFEANLQFEELESKKYIKTVQKLVENDRVRDAVALIASLEKETRTLHGVKSLGQFANFEKALLQTNKSLNHLLSYPELRTVTLVLGNKVANFESFVVQNRWRTLTRVSRRMKAKISPEHVRAPGFFNLQKLTNLHRSIARDIKSMKEISMKSVLSRKDKQQILTKIETLSTEMLMMKKYLGGLKKFNNAIKILDDSYVLWSQEMKPAITLKKIEMEKNGQNVIFGMLGLIGLLCLSLIGGWFVYLSNSKSIRKEMETMAIRAIRDGIVSPLNNFSDSVTPSFERELLKFREYVHRRMSFGTVFQEAVPFSSMLLDSNLNVVWGNQLFYEHFHLSDKSSEDSLSWDYIQRFTNLGEDDPILMALGQGIAGIYQVQVRRTEDEEGVPYEMYVSPVEYAGEKRVMIFFYPLRSLEETLQNQTRSIVGPVSRTLDALSYNNFNQEFKENVSRDFEIAGIGELFEKFSNYNNFVSQQKHGLLTEIEKLENELYDKIKLIDDMKSIQKKINLTSQDINNDFTLTKDSVVHTIDLRYELETEFEKIMTTAKSILKEENGLLARSRKAGSIIEENIRAFESIISSRNDFKELKIKIDDFRSRIGQSVEQTLLFMRRGGTASDQRLEEGLGKIRLEMKGVEQVLSSFTEVIRNLDIGLSKVGLIIEESSVPNFDDFQDKLNHAKGELENSSFQLGHIGRSGERADEVVVNSMRTLFDSFQATKDYSRILEELGLSEEEVAGAQASGESIQEYGDNQINRINT